MLVPIIKIGNSKGIRINKAILEEYKFNENVEIEFTDEGLLLKAPKKPRIGWEKAFKEMSTQKDDTLIIDDFFEDEEAEEWK